MPTSWKNRGTYGKLLKRIIIKQTERFDKCNDDETAVKIAANIGYLIEKLNNILKIVEIQDREDKQSIIDALQSELHAQQRKEWGLM